MVRAGSSQTLICDRCGARFNVMLPRFITSAERITM
jgi:hypothetical protein